MKTAEIIPLPLLFNPLKHHTGYIRQFIEENWMGKGILLKEAIVRDLKQIGGSVMDVYSGEIGFPDICDEFNCYLKTKKLDSRGMFMEWAGNGKDDFRTIFISDGSQWVLKYYDHDLRFVHIFPARFSPHSFRVKANTLRSAILYQIFIGKDFITEENLNTARAIGGLSPVKDVMDSEAITEMIEMLRE